MPEDAGQDATLPGAESGVDASEASLDVSREAASNDVTVAPDVAVDSPSEATASLDAPVDTAAEDAGGDVEEASSEASPCPGTETLCGSTCVDTTTDYANCGGCGVRCGPDTTVTVCQASRCVETLASGPSDYVGAENTTSALAIDSQHVYWTYSESPDGMILSIPIAGGASVFPTPIATGQNIPQYLAIDGVNAYWVNHGNFTVMQAPLAGDGGAAVQLASAANLPVGGTQQIAGITTDGSYVYFHSTDAATNSYAWRVAVGGAGGPTKLDSDGAYGLSALQLAVDSVNLYWTTNFDYLMSVPKAGGSPVIVGDPPSFVDGLTVYGSTLYYAVGGLGQTLNAIVSSSTTPPDGGAYQTLTTLDTTSSTGSSLTPIAVATDGVNVYWANDTTPAQPSILKVSIGGGTPTVLVTGIGGASAIAVDGTSVYWMDDGPDGTTARVMKVTPK